ncbi:MAG: hypothetical protein ACI9VR_004150 [Cognaticolwellia sp.]|jgi:hypothetical protein
MLTRLLALNGQPGRLWVRLVARRGSLFRRDSLDFDDVPEPGQALAELESLDLVHRGIPWSQRLSLLRVPELKVLLREQGLPLSGRRHLLVERLLPTPVPDRVGVWRVSGGALLERLERVWFRSGWRDRSSLLLERIGQVQWVEHPITAPVPAFACRRDWRDFESATSGTESPGALLAAVQGAAPRGIAFRGLDPRPKRARQLIEQLRELERTGETQACVQAYQALLDAGTRRPGLVVQRLAQCLGKLEQPALGADLCLAWRDRVAPELQPALERAGRRLAKKGGVGWRPMAPLRKAPERDLVLRMQPGRPRPRWGPELEPIEAAVQRHCTGQSVSGQQVLQAENGLWTTLFGLLFFDLFWMPVPGMLPVPGMDGPLDLGSPVFVGHRAQAFQERLDELNAGRGAEILARHHAQGAGAQVRGVIWGLTELPVLQAVVLGAGAGLVPVMERLGREGWSARRGLPDLVFVPGVPGAVPDALPSRLNGDLLCVEVKGPTDSLRDGQAVWHDRLLRAGLQVEVWKVRARTNGGC